MGCMVFSSNRTHIIVLLHYSLGLIGRRWFKRYLEVSCVRMHDLGAPERRLAKAHMISHVIDRHSLSRLQI